MSVALTLLVVLLASCPLGRTFLLHLSEKEAADPGAPSSPTQQPNRCQGDMQQAIRNSLLRGLNLQHEPLHQSTKMAELRDKWKAALRASGYTGQAVHSPASTTGNEQDPEAAAMGQPCCQMSSQVFITDLCWENWVIYPESFTFTQCSACSPQPKPADVPSPEDSGTGISPQVSCCQPVAYDLVPFFYLDGSGSLVISSVPMAHQCGCVGQPLLSVHESASRFSNTPPPLHHK
ncbi:gonadal somatic cell derived factor [Engraulis encrasicolus]|uniref:gonadal somatic cell derived factor n=1 Tax=Engraulis encrasicolus TaxID=184585 RepID=UPI002FD539B1